jgi:hypothetical protein
MPTEAEIDEAATHLADDWFTQHGEITEDEKKALALILAGADQDFDVLTPATRTA